jgi:hypothetical protein
VEFTAGHLDRRLARVTYKRFDARGAPGRRLACYDKRDHCACDRGRDRLFSLLLSLLHSEGCSILHRFRPTFDLFNGESPTGSYLESARNRPCPRHSIDGPWRDPQCFRHFGNRKQVMGVTFFGHGSSPCGLRIHLLALVGGSLIFLSITCPDDHSLS